MTHRVEDLVAPGQRSLRKFPLRDVREYALPAGTPILTFDLIGEIVDPHGPSILRRQAILHVEGVARGVRAVGLSDHPVAIVGMKHPDPELGIREPLLRRVTGQALVLRADVDGARDGIDGVDVDGGGQSFHQIAVSIVGQAEPLLTLHPLGGIYRHAQPEPGSALVVADQHRMVVDPHGPAVLRRRAVLLRPLVAIRCVRRQHPLAVLGVDPLLPERGVGRPLLRR